MTITHFVCLSVFVLMLQLKLKYFDLCNRKTSISVKNNHSLLSRDILWDKDL